MSDVVIHFPFSHKLELLRNVLELHLLFSDYLYGNLKADITIYLIYYSLLCLNNVSVDTFACDLVFSIFFTFLKMILNGGEVIIRRRKYQNVMLLLFRLKKVSSNINIK